jgi:cytochrome c-type biogenesis protein CcmH
MTPERRRLLILLVVLITALPLNGQAREERMDDPELQQRFSDLADELRCPKCQNETIAESGAPISSDMRIRVRQLLREGHTDEEILDAMVARFGDFVRYRPEFEPRTWVLWLGPFVAIAVGIGVVVMITLRTRRRPTDESPVLSDEERQRAEHWLRDD